MVSFRGQKKLVPRPDRSPSGCYPPGWVRSKVQRHRVATLYYRVLGEVLSLYRNVPETFLNNNNNTLVMKCEKRNLRKS